MFEILGCCIVQKNEALDLWYEVGTFQRYRIQNISIRSRKSTQIERGRRITGMAKFRASQKLKRQKIEELRKAEYKVCLRRSVSQPALRVQNYTPYDV